MLLGSFIRLFFCFGGLAQPVQGCPDVSEEQDSSFASHRLQNWRRCLYHDPQKTPPLHLYACELLAYHA